MIAFPVRNEKMESSHLHEYTSARMLERLFHRHLEEDEPLYLVVHHHWCFGVIALLKPLLAIIVTWALYIIIPLPPVLYIVLGLNALLCIWLLRDFLDYFLDAWIITDRSVIDVEWHGWFHRTSSRIDYSAIEGVSTEMKGILGTLLRFGTITIEKISTGITISLENVSKPRKIEAIILACQDVNMHTRNLKDTESVKDILSDLIAERIYLHEQEGEDEAGDNET